MGLTIICIQLDTNNRIDLNNYLYSIEYHVIPCNRINITN